MVLHSLIVITPHVMQQNVFTLDSTFDVNIPLMKEA